MQISSTPTAYGGNEAQRLLNMLLNQQNPPAGQDLPSSDSTSTSSTTTTTPTPPTSTPASTQFAADTLSSLLSAQEGPPSAANVASQVINAADTNGDGSLSLSEVENALGASSTSSNASTIAQEFAQIDTNGDGQISATELTNALQAQNGSQGADGTQGAQGAHHHHHHAHHAGGSQAGGSQESSSNLASQILGTADTNGDGDLSLSEIENALGVSSTSSAATNLTTAFNQLDTNGDGQLSQSELTTGIDAFRSAHHWGGQSATQSQSTQAVSA